MTEHAIVPASFKRMRNVHFVGIAGAGMSGIAEVMLNLGYRVSGSDQQENQVTRRLQELGAKLFIGHAADNIEQANVVVVSSAIPEDNPEVLAAREHRLPVVPRAEMLAELMRFRRGIAVAGTHGKTTTTTLTASLLAEAGLDPTFVVGGLVNAVGSNARLGKGEYLVAEADESDASFLLLQPTIALITNIDRDHLESYDNDFNKLRQAFLEFLHHLPFYGVAVLCIDDPEVAGLLPEVTRAVVTYGFSAAADIRATDLRQRGRNMYFSLHLPDQRKAIPVQLNLPGKHNVSNALGALAVAWELGLDLSSISACLGDFKGIGRRFSEVGTLTFGAQTVDVIEDYGHHPRELQATLEAARRGWPERRLVVVFQPHRFTRTHELFDEFVNVLSQADVLILTDVYAAGEAVIAGAESKDLCTSIRARGRVNPVLIHDVFSLPEELPVLLRDDDLVLLLGAGNVGTIAQQLREDGFAGVA